MIYCLHELLGDFKCLCALLETMHCTGLAITNFLLWPNWTQLRRYSQSNSNWQRVATIVRSQSIPIRQLPD